MLVDDPAIADSNMSSLPPIGLRCIPGLRSAVGAGPSVPKAAGFTQAYGMTELAPSDAAHTGRPRLTRPAPLGRSGRTAPRSGSTDGQEVPAVTSGDRPGTT